MNLSSLEAVLLFALSLPLVLKYRILPVTGTSYIYFSLYFILNFINIYISYFKTVLNPKKINNFKWLLTVSVISISLYGAIWTAIIDRGKIAPGSDYGTHDIVLQLESALRYLSDNKNPYVETYFGTPLEDWNYEESGQKAVNPALYHFVMPPWYLLFSYPFYFTSNRIMGFFDGRMPLLFLIIILTILIYVWFNKSSNGRLILLLVMLNPSSVNYLIEGRSDMFVLAFILIGLYLLEKKKFIMSAVFMGLAMVSKQTAWFILPVYLSGVYLLDGKKLENAFKSFIVLGLTGLVISLPFIIWNFQAFLNSTIFYLSGNTANSYPVSGYGLSMIFHQLGVINSLRQSYPFILWQIALGLPAVYIGCRYLLKKFSISRLVFAYAFILFIIWYTSRYFNNSHIAFISQLLIFAALSERDSYGLKV